MSKATEALSAELLNLRERIRLLEMQETAAGADPSAIHDNVPAEISAIAAKAVPIGADYLVIEDSAAANAKKSITIGNLPIAATVPNHDHTGDAGDGAQIGHNTALSGIQGGAAGDYYHITAARRTALIAMVAAGLEALTAAEVDQLENIGVTTISAAQWAYLGALNQALATGDAVGFLTLGTADWIFAGGALETGTTLTTGGYIKCSGGLYVGANVAPDADDIHFDGNLKSMKNATYYDVYGYKPLTTPLTSTSFDGDSFSTTAKTLIDLSAAFGVPAGVQAVDVHVRCRDSASAGTNVWMVLGPTNSAGLGRGCSPYGRTNNADEHNDLTVPCDANGDIYYQVSASGASTFDIWIEIWGYFI